MRVVRGTVLTKGTPLVTVVLLETVAINWNFVIQKLLLLPQHLLSDFCLVAGQYSLALT